MLTEKERKEAVARLEEVIAAYGYISNKKYALGDAIGVDRALRVYKRLYPLSEQPGFECLPLYEEKSKAVASYIMAGGKYDSAVAEYSELPVLIAIHKARDSELVRKEMPIVESYCRSRLLALINGIMPIIKGV